ncbi:MAG TPA: M2 family metallopeptidase [Verrucomicrobiota bacterium]|nr:M2 family metallopeptidase [Verrucomicrobiota bacterium]HNT15796.1 M2 family metallopeptidase [Verrucomicrobiota bacterium]
MRKLLWLLFFGTGSLPFAAAQSVADADAFVRQAEAELAAHSVLASRADWVNLTYITEDTDALAAEFNARGTELSMRLAKAAAKFAYVEGLSFDVRRKLNFLKQSIVLPAPEQPGAAAELSGLATRMQSSYGTGKGTIRGEPINGPDLEAAMSTVRDPALLKEMWTSWHDNVGTPMRRDYARLVALANAGARELGYADVGLMWRSGYDMPPDEFARELDRLWLQVKPLYDQLHCYVRARLHEHYGAAVQPATGPIRADLLGNLWAQDWAGIYPLVAPAGVGDVGYDLTSLLTARKFTPVQMVKTGEAFYTSLGFPPLPETFWRRSLFVKPADREVVCHASAWDVDNLNDLRIKMCIKINGDDFRVIHHELGHNYYQRAYNQQPFLFLNGANDGFHEAIGDFIALSLTPEYLVQIGLLDADRVPGADKDIGLLLRQALDKVAFLPFGLLMDKWRWGVFAGATQPEHYERDWNALRRQYQGVVPPVARPDTAFDPGAKYHIPANTPYARYFIACILQFQLYQSAARQIGWTGPLHRCSFYGNKEVGERLRRMLALGASRPWPEALEQFTGTRRMDASALITYFQPLLDWLQTQNQGRRCGW